MVNANHSKRALANGGSGSGHQDGKRRCVAKTCRGDQCQRHPVFGVMLCCNHLKQSKKGLLYGRVDREDPAPKSRQLLRVKHSKTVLDAAGSAKRKKQSHSRFLWLTAAGGTELGSHASERRKWVAADIWGCVLGSRNLHVRASIYPPSEASGPWDSAVIKAAESVGRDLASSSGSRQKSVHVKVTAEAVRLLRQGMLEWLSSMLADLHGLCLHRVSLLDGVLDPPTQAEFCRRDYDAHFRSVILDEQNEENSLRNWTGTLKARQRLQRIGPVDLRILLGWPYAASALTRCTDDDIQWLPESYRLPERKRQQFLQLIAGESLGSV